jgi:hypothetical protein
MTRSRNYPTLFAAIALASCILSLPAAALVAEGTPPSIFERHGLPQWPDNPWISPLDPGLPTMTLQPIGLLAPLVSAASASVASQASLTPPAVVSRHRTFPSLRRISVHRVVYARLKAPSRSSSPPPGMGIFIGGLY